MSIAPPGAAGQEAPARHASWLELFLDLVFVAVAAQLATTLHGDPDPARFGTFLALFFPAWWAWMNITVFTNLIEDDSPRARLLLLATMLALAAMAAAIPDGLGERAPVFALGYAAARLVLFAQWWPLASTSGPHQLPRWRPLVYCLCTGLLWAVSAVTPAPWRFALWIAALIVEIGLVLVGSGRWLPSRLHVGHLVERVGLFVIIVLGESVISLVRAVGDAWSAPAALVAVLGFVLLAAVWWSYFDFGSVSAERQLQTASAARSYALARDVIAFLHFFVVSGIIALAGGLGTAVADSGHAHLPAGALAAMAGGQAVYHAAHTLIALRFGRPAREVATWAAPAVGVPLLVIALGDYLPPWAAVALLAAETVGHLLYARRAAWLRGIGARA